MSNNHKKISSKMKKAFVFFIIMILLAGTVSCKTLAPKQSGVLSEEYKMNISGEITFTISNESGTQEEAQAPIAFARAFERKYPNVKVSIDDSPRTTYATRISTGEIGDVFWCDSTDANKYKREHDALVMLDYYMEKLGVDRSNIYNGAMSSGMIDGRLYMVPRNFGQQVLIYNADALQASGITIPSGGEALDWETFKQVCRQLTTYENGEISQVGAGFKCWWGPVWQAFAAGWGGKWCDAENKKVSFVTDANVLKGLSEMFGAISEGWLAVEDVPYSGDKKAYNSLPDYKRVFRTFGDMQWFPRYGNSYDNKDIAWDFCPFPAFPVHKVCAGATGYVVYNRSRNTDAAAALALFFLTEEGQYAYHSAENGGNCPLLKSQADQDFWKMPNNEKWKTKNFDAFVSYPDSNIPSSIISMAPYEIAQELESAKMQSLFTEIINGTKSYEDAFSAIEKKCNETWSKLTQY